MRLEGVETPKARALRARSLLNLRRDAEALAVLSEARKADLDSSASAENNSLSSVALYRLERFAESHVAQVAAREDLATVTAWAIRAELRYYESSLHYAMGHRQKALETSIRSEAEIATYYESEPSRSRGDTITVASSRASLLNARGTVEQSYGRYKDALTSFSKALTIHQSDPFADSLCSARLLANMTSIMDEDVARHKDICNMVLRISATMSWTTELNQHHFFVMRELGCSFALFGHFRKAFEYFRSSAKVSSSIMDRLLASIDCALLLEDLGFDGMAAHMLREVTNTARNLTLSLCKEQDADTLLVLTTHTARNDASVAQNLFDAYLSLKASKLHLTTAFTDERFQGNELRAKSALAMANGAFKFSIDLDKEAFAIYERLDIRAHASRVAFRLAKLTRSSAKYCRYVLEEVSRRPTSSFAVKVSRANLPSTLQTS